MKTKHVAGMVCGFLALLWLWPNVIHEPVHLLALQLQGSGGNIVFDWGFPPHPYITRESISSIVGGLFFLTAPTLLSVAILGLLAARKKVSLWGGTLAIYLTFDAVVNLLGWRSNTSDFHWLVAVPGGNLWALGASLAVCLAGTFIFLRLLKGSGSGVSGHHGGAIGFVRSKDCVKARPVVARACSSRLQ